jgi:hypothetical protein
MDCSAKAEFRRASSETSFFRACHAPLNDAGTGQSEHDAKGREAECDRRER